MQRNLLNLAIVFVVVFFVFGCFCRSDRDFQDDAPANSTTSENQSNSQTGQTKSGKTFPVGNNNSAPLATKNSGDKKSDDGDFVVQELPVENPRYAQIDQQLKEEKVLESAAAQFNQALALPFDISLQTKACGEINAFYNPNDHSITVCYELMEYYYKLFKAAGQSDDEASENMSNAVRFAFLHEVGHALIDAYKLPIMGNEEDAADRCSAYISLEEIQDGVKYVLAAADAFSIESKLSDSSKRNMADEHLLGEQRFYNSLCMIYGSNPNKYGGIVNNGYLPEARAVRCPSEYERNIQSWRDLLKPWRKD